MLEQIRYVQSVESIWGDLIFHINAAFRNFDSKLYQWLGDNRHIVLKEKEYLNTIFFEEELRGKSDGILLIFSGLPKNEKIRSKIISDNYEIVWDNFGIKIGLLLSDKKAFIEINDDQSWAENNEKIEEFKKMYSELMAGADKKTRSSPLRFRFSYFAGRIFYIHALSKIAGETWVIL